MATYTLCAFLENYLLRITNKLLTQRIHSRNQDAPNHSTTDGGNTQLTISHEAPYHLSQAESLLALTVLVEETHEPVVQLLTKPSDVTSGHGNHAQTINKRNRCKFTRHELSQKRDHRLRRKEEKLRASSKGIRVLYWLLRAQMAVREGHRNAQRNRRKAQTGESNSVSNVPSSGSGEATSYESGAAKSGSATPPSSSPTPSLSRTDIEGKTSPALAQKRLHKSQQLLFPTTATTHMYQTKNKAVNRSVSQPFLHKNTRYALGSNRVRFVSIS
jgi:hypothetical protein